MDGEIAGDIARGCDGLAMLGSLMAVINSAISVCRDVGLLFGVCMLFELQG